LGAGPAGGGQDVIDREKIFAFEPSGEVRALGTIGAIFAAATGLDAEETAALHLFTPPMAEMHLAALRDQVEQRPVVEIRELVEIHPRGRKLARTLRGRKREVGN
jgi:hypothetical protein